MASRAITPVDGAVDVCLGRQGLFLASGHDKSGLASSASSRGSGSVHDQSDVLRLDDVGFDAGHAAPPDGLSNEADRQYSHGSSNAATRFRVEEQTALAYTALMSV
ncbi:hypothetical protein H310_13000 [Aphanomyces invadans]|uniref:Uncharacterized protein n=1 Tax=Aphanomyces invadans TaxID=157072 RepID=A0A024TFF6_9STRA|nr:hypothetical protein H310_13000 [Aphanomyces invadans]ETV92773.1 hypothetical protein H310_13000 [Aphanomyces invadans]|eukprot:XP_008878543.1 hypothetical protein H310_13000 [Aphanomyces invadans]